MESPAGFLRPGSRSARTSCRACGVDRLDVERIGLPDIVAVGERRGTARDEADEQNAATRGSS